MQTKFKRVKKFLKINLKYLLTCYYFLGIQSMKTPHKPHLKTYSNFGIFKFLINYLLELKNQRLKSPVQAPSA